MLGLKFTHVSKMVPVQKGNLFYSANAIENQHTGH